VVLAIFLRDLEPATLHLDILDGVPGVGLAIRLKAILVVDGHRAKGQGLAGPVMLGRRWLEQREHSSLDVVEIADMLQGVVQDDLFAAMFRQRVLVQGIAGSTLAAAVPPIVCLDGGGAVNPLRSRTRSMVRRLGSGPICKACSSAKIVLAPMRL